jgi:riboflavin kinase/FMN adenylyltransferase
LTTTFLRGIDNYSKSSDHAVIATIGTFDGIHLGHQEIFRRVRQQSKQQDVDSVLITFDPHPRVLVSPDNIPMLLTTIEEKGKFIPHFFDGKVLILEFTKQLMNMAAEDFVRKILVDIVGIKKLIVGYDHAIGKNRTGNIPALRAMGAEMGFEVEVVEPVLIGGRPVSSSRIRDAISSNHYPDALKMLGHDYAIYGTVMKGIGLGKKLGYPTANVNYNLRKLLPGEGVYACWAQVNGEVCHGMMFIGRNHFNPEDRISVEANLFKFDRDIYEEEITVYPTHFIRENRKFDSTEALVEQISLDKQHVLQIIKKEQINGYDQRSKGSDYQRQSPA